MKKDRTNLYIGLCLLLFIAFAIGGVLWTSSDIQMNPYEKEDLQPATLHYLDKPNFKRNIITPEKLEVKIKSGEPFFVFYFNPACGGCEESLDTLAAEFKKEKVDYYLFNILEFSEPYSFIDPNLHHHDYSIGYYGQGVDFYLYGDEKFDGIYKKWVKGLKNTHFGVQL